MERKYLQLDLEQFPAEFQKYLKQAKIYDSSSSPEARTYFIKRDRGYFLKVAATNSLKDEATMDDYFYKKKIGPEVVEYLSLDQDYLLTRQVPGYDCVQAEYLDQPERLVKLLAENLAWLHQLDFQGCPITRTSNYLKKALDNFEKGHYDSNFLAESSFSDIESAHDYILAHRDWLKADILIHGDFCQPNIILDNWNFSGYIDLDCAGVGDRHVDIYWALHSLKFNFKTDKYASLFIDTYGRDKVDFKRLKLIDAIEIFG